MDNRDHDVTDIGGFEQGTFRGHLEVEEEILSDDKGVEAEKSVDHGNPLSTML